MSQRIIKFRAWDKEKKKMYPVRTLSFWGDAGITTDARKHDDIMQYTGLKDKNGVEIYEGDILLLKSLPQEVYWFKDTCSFRLATYGEKQFDKTRDISFVSCAEVIGNIYQDPELLKGGK